MTESEPKRKRHFDSKDELSFKYAFNTHTFTNDGLNIALKYPQRMGGPSISQINYDARDKRLWVWTKERHIFYYDLNFYTMTEVDIIRGNVTTTTTTSTTTTTTTTTSVERTTTEMPEVGNSTVTDSTAAAKVKEVEPVTPPETDSPEEEDDETKEDVIPNESEPTV